MKNKAIILLLSIFSSSCGYFSNYAVHHPQIDLRFGRFERWYNAFHPEEAHIEGYKGMFVQEKKVLNKAMFIYSSHNKKICDGLSLSECISLGKEDIAYYEYKFNEIINTGVEVPLWAYENLKRRQMQVLSELKSQIYNGKVVIDGEEWDAPDYAYIPTKGFLGTNLEYEMRHIFTSGIYLPESKIDRKDTVIKKHVDGQKKLNVIKNFGKRDFSGRIIFSEPAFYPSSVIGVGGWPDNLMTSKDRLDDFVENYFYWGERKKIYSNKEKLLRVLRWQSDRVKKMCPDFSCRKLINLFDQEVK